MIRAEGNRLSHIANGEIRTDAKAPISERLHHLHDAVVAVIGAFYENVRRPDPDAPLDGRGRNVVLEFRPDPPQDMLVACLWSRWRAPGETDLLSFAAITDEPPP